MLFSDQFENELSDAAIACYHAALQVFTYESNPTKYATIDMNLGIAYHEVGCHKPFSTHRRTGRRSLECQVWHPEAEQ